MVFEADCGVSTVLEALRVASTSRSLVPGECWAISFSPFLFYPWRAWVGGNVQTFNVSRGGRAPHGFIEAQLRNSLCLPL